MKQILLLLLFFSVQLNLKGQVVLNEVYPIPGNGRHEFFELYNFTTGAAPVNMDVYSLVTYFEDPGNKKGFYVLDLPAISIASQTYFVGAAANPFNYQGISNQPAHFSWNDLAFLTANSGYLRKWQVGNSVPAAVDGNEFYDLVAIPANFNDFFNKIGGGNASYSVFLYKNGVLQNCFLGGIGGASFIPTYIVTMPDLFIDMAGTATDHTIQWSTYGNVAFESVIQEVGTDNGYIRSRDGFCGAWLKSSAGVNHTPGATNGGSTYEPATISVSAVISPGTPITGPYVVYDVVGAPASSFPVTVQVYIDNGSTAGALDASDTFVEHNTEYNLNEGPFMTFFTPPGNIILVVTTNAGCIDRILHIPNTGGVLPVKLTTFNYSKRSPALEFNWSVTGNEDAKQFELESGSNGSTFRTRTIIPATGRSGAEHYMYSILPGTDRFYRLAIKDHSGKIFYSGIIEVEQEKTSALTIVADPSGNMLKVGLSWNETAPATVSIYNASGARMLTRKLNVIKGTQQLMIPAEGLSGTGIYIIEIASGSQRITGRFVRQ